MFRNARPVGLASLLMLLLMVESSSITPTVSASPPAGGTYTAATCNRSDVNSVINGPTHTAVDGDTIQIPSGSCTWTTGITVPTNIGITITGAGTPNTAASVNGASASCASGTVITDNVPGNSMITFATSTGNGTARVSCLQITTTLGSNATTSPISAAGRCNASACPNLRVDNVTFNGALDGAVSNSDTMIVTDNMQGVLDHNTMTATRSGGLWEFVNFSNSAWQGVGAFGDNSFF